jgi:hypothetical protein
VPALLTVGLIGVTREDDFGEPTRSSRPYRLALDRRSKKRRGSMKWQAKLEKQKKAG